METLVIYFSQKGKTKEAARRIAQLSGADLAEIKTHKSYQMSYRKTVFTSLKEILLNERPELDMEIPDISAYDRILIGSPIWCGTFPNAVFSFLDKVNLNGKKAAIFTTSGATEPQKIAVKIKKKYSAKWCRPFNANHATDENITDWLKQYVLTNRNADEMHSPVVVKQVHELKDTQKGVELMSHEMEKIYSEGMESGEKRGELKKAKETALSLAEMGLLVDKIAKAVNHDVNEVQKWIDENMCVAK